MELFKELTQLHGVSGYEREVRAFIKEKVQGYADEVIEDAIGNLIVFKKVQVHIKRKSCFVRIWMRLVCRLSKLNKMDVLW